MHDIPKKQFRALIKFSPENQRMIAFLQKQLHFIDQTKSKNILFPFEVIQVNNDILEFKYPEDYLILSEYYFYYLRVMANPLIPINNIECCKQLLDEFNKLVSTTGGNEFAHLNITFDSIYYNQTSGSVVLGEPGVFYVKNCKIFFFTRPNIIAMPRSFSRIGIDPEIRYL